MMHETSYDIYSLDDISKRITPVMEKYDIPTAYVFGSYARGEATENSDVDILISGCEISGFCLFSDILQDMTEAIGKEVDLIQELSLNSYDDPDTVVLRESIIRDRRLIYEQR